LPKATLSKITLSFLMTQLDNITVDKTFTTFNLWVIFDEIFHFKVTGFCSHMHLTMHVLFASYDANTE